jgi:thioredoxin reductase
MYDVLIIGGGAAGLNAAIMLGRSRRSVLIIDSGEPRNAPAQGVHGFLSRDSINPAELLAIGRDEARSYGTEIVSGRVTGARRDGDAFEVTLSNGDMAHGRRLLVTTGLVDELPDIPGVRERWGHDVIHCPFCHGWEVRDQAIGILATGPAAVHQALLFRQWSANITLFLNGMPEPSDAERRQLAARGVTVVDGLVESLKIDGDALAGVRLAGGEVVPVQAVVVAPKFVARAGFLAELGLAVSDSPMGAHVPSDANGLTSVPGVWVAGNVTDLKAQVLASAAAGAWTAVMINMDLMEDEMAAALLVLEGSGKPAHI